MDLDENWGGGTVEMGKYHEYAMKGFGEFASFFFFL